MPPQMTRLEALYAAETDAEALARQRAQAADRHPCCGEQKVNGHHIVCSKRPKDDPPPLIDGQLLIL